MDMNLLVAEMSKAFDVLVEGLRDVAKTLTELFKCFCEEKKEEKTFAVSSPKQYGTLLKKVSRNRTKSLYSQPYIQVPRHLAYQKRYYQR